MNATIVTTLWRQRLTSPVRMAVLAMLGGVPLVMVAFAPGVGLTPLKDGMGLALTLGAGLIGQDMSSGVLQLLYARPVRRPEYVVSRWLGVAVAIAVVSLLQIAIACALLAARGAPPTSQDIVMLGAGRVLEGFGTAAVLTLLSSLLGGLGDLALYLLGGMGAGILQIAGQAKRWLWLERAGSELTAFLSPTVDFARLVAATPMPWFPIVSYVSTVVLCLALAIVVMNRKELSYASG